MTNTPSRDKVNDDLSDARRDYLEFITSNPDEIKILRATGELMRVGQWDDPQLALLYSFGMPQDTQLALRHMPGARFGVKYKEFSVELFGVVGGMPPDIERQSERVFESKIWRSHVIDFSAIPEGEIHAGGYIGIQLADGGTVQMQIWRTRVFVGGSDMYCEELWHGRLRNWFRRIENIPVIPDHRSVTAQVKKLADGLGLPTFFVQQNTRGDELSEERFKVLGLEAIKKISPKVKKLTDRPFAKVIGYNRETVSKYRTKYPEVWALLLAEFAKRKS